MQRVFGEHREIYTWLTIDLVKKGLKKRKIEEADKIEEAISDLTNPTFEGSTSQESDEPAAPPPMNISIIQDEELPPQTSKPKVGRPRGTTMKATMEKEAKKEALIIDIASSWSEKIEKEKAEERKRMKKNELDNLIKIKKEEHGLTDAEVNKKAIQMRTYRKRLLVARHPGPTSPMKPVEEYIVSILNQMANMRQALCVSEGLALANGDRRTRRIQVVSIAAESAR
jgi:hypothetical protein